MPSAFIQNSYKAILSGYGRIIKQIFFFLFLSGITLIISTAIVYPLWYLSVNHGALYTAFASLCILLLLIFLGYRKIINRPRSGKKSGRELIGTVGRFLLKFFLLVICLLLLYLSALFYSAKNFYAAAPLTIGFIVFLGFFLFVKKRRKTPENTA